MIQEDRDRGECPYCGVFVRFQGTGTVSIKSDGPTQAVGYLCPSCEEGLVVFVKGGFWRRYPPRQAKDIPGVPAKVMEAFREAVLAVDAGAPHAAACMIRRCVASACSEQGIPDEEDGKWLPLQARINRLKDKLLPATFAAASAAKLLGDAGAHEEAEERLGDIDKRTVNKTIAVVRQCLANLYELPEQIKQLEIGPTEEQP